MAIAMDDAEAARVAARRLIDLGHRRIGFITGSDEYALSAARLEGYADALRAHGLFDPALVASGDFSFASGEKGMTALLDLPQAPTAVVASNDQMALAALRVASGRGLSVPKDLSIISFDDTPIVRFSHPPLSAIRQPIAAMTAQAAELLMRAKAGDADLPSDRLVPFSLIERGSTGPASA